jgi:hypothetical protein
VYTHLIFVCLQEVMAKLGEAQEVKATHKCPLCGKGVPDTHTYLEGMCVCVCVCWNVRTWR